MNKNFKNPEKLQKKIYTAKEVRDILEIYVDKQESNSESFKKWQKINNFSREEAIFVSVDEFIFNNKI